MSTHLKQDKFTHLKQDKFTHLKQDKFTHLKQDKFKVLRIRNNLPKINLGNMHNNRDLFCEESQLQLNINLARINSVVWFYFS